MLHLQIDAHSGIPVYRQVMDQLKHYVASGTLKAGDQLPSIRDLARSLTVNPATIVKAYNELQHEGVIELKQGKGAFVAESARLVSQQERKARLRRLASQLAVEAMQVGAQADLVMEVVGEEIGKLHDLRAKAARRQPPKKQPTPQR